MKSIRFQLLLWLVPSFIMIALLAGATLYFSEKRRLNSDLDNELNKLARAVKLANRMPTSPRRFDRALGVPNDIAKNTKRLLNDEDIMFYIQAWDETGTTLSKSENLTDYQLDYLNEPHQNRHYNSQLASGEDIRVNSFTIRIGPPMGRIAVSVAIDKTEMNKQLATLTYKLIIGGIFFCCLLSFMLVFIIRRTLAPIQYLSEKVAEVEAGTLHNRLNVKSVPTEITPLISRLNQLLERLEKSFERERQFNNDLAHELRTPLAAIRTTSEVAMKWPEQSSVDDYRYIAESSTQLQNTIDSLLSLARIENSGSEMTSEKVNVSTVIQECVALQSTLVKERGISIAFLLNEQLVIESNPHLLRIIISNLINNAVEYAPKNSEVFLSCKSSHSIFTIANFAPNLDQNDLSTMFDRLWRKDSSRTGTNHVGLGLSIAHSAATAISLKLRGELDERQMLIMSLVGE